MNVAVFRINKSPSSCEIYLSSPEQTNKQTNKQAKGGATDILSII